MTNLEALKYNLADTHGIVLTEGHFLKALADQSLDPQQEYTALNAKAIDMCTVDLYEKVLGAPNMQEGDINYSITNKEYIQNMIDTLLIKWGLPIRYGKTVPVINSSSPW